MTSGGIGSGTERRLGRYALFDEIAQGGMATVHLGRMLGPVGFSKTVAIKRLHPHLARDPEFVSMFLDEARLAARVQHPNVVATLDVVAAEGEVFLVLEYVQGESFSHLLKATRIKGVPVAPRVLSSVLVNTLHGLHAAHEASDEHGHPLGIVHRDVSPQNILVGVDGVARVLDFGVAKAAGRLQSTRDGQLKGKIAYMAPEQIRGDLVDRRTDIYAAAAVLWEGLTGRRLVHGMNEGQVLHAVLAGGFPPPSAVHPGTPPEVDALVMRGLAMDPAHRFPTARELAIALERTVGVASPYEVAEWVQSVGAEALSIRAARVREMESTSAVRVSLQDSLAQSADPAFDASRSGVLESSVSQPNRPLPPAPGVGEGSVSFALHPSFAVQEAPAGMMPQPAYGAPMPAMPVHGPHPVAAAPARSSGLKVALASVLVSLLFGLSVLLLIFWFRGRRPVEDSGIEAQPSPGTATAPAAAPPSLAAPAPSPPVAAPPSAEPAARAEPEVAPAAPSAAPKTDKPEDPKPAAVTKRDEPSKGSSKPAEPEKTKPPSGDKPASKPAKGCDSPFYVDSNGIKHIKPECM
ncbi:MAG: serine/threonine-protein kinase [Polyangiaceae bacterium]